MSRLSGLARFLVVLAVVAALQATGVREASADASGCSIFSGGLAGKNPTDNLPECISGGGGCYECAYSHTNQSGYDICAEDTDGIEDCTLNVSSFPDWWADPDPGVAAPDSAPSGDNPDNGTGTGDDGGGVDLGGGDGGGGDGGPYYYNTPITYLPPSYLYSPPYHRPYHP
jgi:hypothetical protein